MLALIILGDAGINDDFEHGRGDDSYQEGERFDLKSRRWLVGATAISRGAQYSDRCQARVLVQGDRRGSADAKGAAKHCNVVGGARVEV